MTILVQCRLLPYEDFGLRSPLSATNVTNDAGLIDGMDLSFSFFWILFLLSKSQFCLSHLKSRNAQVSSTKYTRFFFIS